MNYVLQSDVLVLSAAFLFPFPVSTPIPLGVSVERIWFMAFCTKQAERLVCCYTAAEYSWFTADHLPSVVQA